MKRKHILAYILCLTMILSFMPQAYAARDGNIKNIIYMIPDGGGMEPFWLADDLKKAGGWDRSVYPNSTVTEKGEMYARQYLVGAVTTHSANATVTDSAAAGTALSSGYKTNNAYIGVGTDKKPNATILEAAQYAGKKTGIVTTYEWTNATPASFSAHDTERSNYSPISEQIVNQGIDVVLGGGFDAAKWGSTKDAEIRGYDIVNTRKDLENVKAGDKIWGNLVPGAFPYDIEKDAETPSLAEMTKAAITALDEGEKGFFLMVEGSKIDGGGHANNVRGMVGDFLAFDEACRVALQYAEGRDDTLVVIVPDHDTGGMNLPNKTDRAVESLRQGSEPADVTWETTGHTARNGGLFMYVPKGFEYPEGIHKEVIGTKRALTRNVVDNIVIAPYMAELMGVRLDDITAKLFVDVTDLGTYSSDKEMFKFTDGKGYSVMVKRNASYAFFDDKAVSLDGQIALYINNRFYVPQLLLDIMNGIAISAPYDNVAAAYKSGMDIYIPDGDITNIRGRVTISKLVPDRTISGKIKFTAPENFAALAPISFEAPRGTEKQIVEFACPEIDMLADKLKFEYAIETNDGNTHYFTSEVNGFVYAGHRNSDIVIDGVIDEAAWDNSIALVCDSKEQVVSLSGWNGDRDLSGKFRLMWDEKYFYLGAEVTDETFSQDNAADSMWQGDSIQLGIFYGTELMTSGKAGGNFEEIGLALVKDVPTAYRFLSQGKTNSGIIKEGDGFDLEIKRDGDGLTYEMKISWKELIGMDYVPKIGDTLGFSGLINDNDGEGRRSYMEYGSGIGGIKNASQFVIMSLLDVEKSMANEIKVVINGSKVSFDVKPVIEDGRVLVPVRAIFEKLGANVSWDQKTRTVNSQMGDRKVSLTIDDTCVNVNGEKRVIDVPARILDGRTLVPVRAVSESYNCDVKWDGNTRTVTITY